MFEFFSDRGRGAVHLPAPMVGHPDALHAQLQAPLHVMLVYGALDDDRQPRGSVCMQKWEYLYSFIGF